MLDQVDARRRPTRIDLPAPSEAQGTIRVPHAAEARQAPTGYCVEWQLEEPAARCG